MVIIVNKIVEVFKTYSFMLYPDRLIACMELIESFHNLQFHLNIWKENCPDDNLVYSHLRIPFSKKNNEIKYSESEAQKIIFDYLKLFNYEPSIIIPGVYLLRKISNSENILKDL